MLYFAYGSNLNAKAVHEWCRPYGHKSPVLRNPRAAVLENYRLCFPVFSEFWGGGTADIEYDAGKYVSGALYELTDADARILDLKVGRKTEGDREIGLYKPIEVEVSLLGHTDPIKCVTYQGVSVEKYHIPPTTYYMDLLIQGAYAVGLSMMWISYLQSFPTQQGKAPRRPAHEAI
ncbi:MAG: gamma-glutamylcyclotransferase family protein [Phycisphaerae bacterium]